MNNKQELFLILDFGSQYTHLIKSSLLKHGFKSKIVPGDTKFKGEGKNIKVMGVILSGGAASVYDSEVDFDPSWLESEVPVLGICYGHQLIAKFYGGKVKKHKAEFGESTLSLVTDDLIFKGFSKKFKVWMSHKDAVTKLPNNFITIAKSDYSDIAAFKHKDKNIYGVQFHPEVSHTEHGDRLLTNFCTQVCKATPGDKWTAKKFISDANPKSIIKKSKVIVGLSGGVDSFTMTTMLRKSLNRDQLLAVYIDSGLMPDETQSEVEMFCKKYDIQLKVVQAEDQFFEVLKGKMRTIEKGTAIGELFIRLFEKEAKTFGTEWFAQGTIWSDVIESGITKFSSVIKPHHNVGGLPEKMDIKLYEPLRELFKDQVREVAKELDLPDWIVGKKVFPGPGFAIRIEGIVTKQKAKLVRTATKIIEDIVYKSEVSDDIWMAFAILADAPSLGVKGDKHVQNEHIIVIRIVESKNSMTAQFSRKAYPYLSEISRRIVDETDVGRVVYDVTDKPPATIEWQ